MVYSDVANEVPVPEVNSELITIYQDNVQKVNRVIPSFGGLNNMLTELVEEIIPPEYNLSLESLYGF